MTDFMSFPTPREHVLTFGNTTIGVIPDICLVTHFQVGPWQILYRPMQTGNIKRWGLPLMIPNFSRLNNGTFQEKGTKLPIHGFGRILPWTTIEKDSTHLVIQLTSSETTLASYPYEFTFNINISVEEGILTYKLTVENHSNENMPIALGFHPYFTVAQSQKMNIRASRDLKHKPSIGLSIYLTILTHFHTRSLYNFLAAEHWKLQRFHKWISMPFQICRSGLSHQRNPTTILFASSQQLEVKMH